MVDTNPPNLPAVVDASSTDALDVDAGAGPHETDAADAPARDANDVADVVDDVGDASDTSDASDARIRDAGPPVTFEAPSLARTSSGIGTLSSTDVGGGCPANPCAYVQFDPAGSPRVGDFIEFTLPSLGAGSYNVTLDYKGNSNRGIYQVTIDGVARGVSCDQYTAAPVYFEHCSLGIMSLATSGPHQLRLTVTGKNPASTGYFTNIERFTFAPL